MSGHQSTDYADTLAFTAMEHSGPQVNVHPFRVPIDDHIGLLLRCGHRIIVWIYGNWTKVRVHPRYSSGCNSTAPSVADGCQIGLRSSVIWLT